MSLDAEPSKKITYRLELTSRERFRPKYSKTDGLRIERVTVPFAPLNWFLHQVVGTPYRWGGRQDWGEREWTNYVQRQGLETWVAYVEGNPAGYYELESQPDGSQRIACFGLLAEFQGRGLGAHLLSHAVERAWEREAKRVWLTTCNHDHPHALKNYTARGFEVVQQTEGPANPPASHQTPFRGVDAG